MLGINLPWQLPKTKPGNDQAWVNGNVLQAGGKVVLEDFSFDPDPSQGALVKQIGAWLADNALLKTAEYEYWRASLPDKLCILPNDAFRDFVLYSTEVQTHIKIDQETKTVMSGALWTAETLPTDSVFYVPLMATPPRSTGSSFKSGKNILDKITTLELHRMHLGGDETTGQGMVALRFGSVS
jgi:CRISPR-associated protein Cmr4